MCEIDVLLNDAENRKTAELKTEEGKVEKHYLFYDGESVSGKVNRVYVIYTVRFRARQGSPRYSYTKDYLHFLSLIYS